MEPITKLQDEFVRDIRHLRDNLFLIGYVNGLIEMRDLSEDEPLLSFQVPIINKNGPNEVVDMDFKKDET